MTKRAKQGAAAADQPLSVAAPSPEGEGTETPTAAGWPSFVPPRLQRIAGLLGEDSEKRLAGLLDRSGAAVQSLRVLADDARRTARERSGQLRTFAQSAATDAMARVRDVRASAFRSAGNTIGGGLEVVASELHRVAERVRTTSGAARPEVAPPARDVTPVHAVEALGPR